MKHASLFLILIVLLFSSCASILNSDMTRVSIETDQAAEVEYENREYQTNKRNKASIWVPRYDTAVVFTIRRDSIEKEISLPSVNSEAFYLNFIYNFGVGALIDRDNPKRYGYRSRIYVSATDEESKYFKSSPFSRQNQWYVHFSMPYVNSFLFRPEGELDNKVNTGYLGIALGIEYYYKAHRYLSFKGSAITDFFLPFPAPATREFNYETMASSYISLTHNHKLKGYSIGYGLSFGENAWNFQPSEQIAPGQPTEFPIRSVHQFLGLEIPQYVQFGDRFHLGLIYRPNFYRFDINPGVQYEHVISLDLAWKFRI